MSEITNFIFNEIDKDIASGVYDKDTILTRFPPEPNGYLHIGHAKAICINFSVKKRYSAKTNLRFDDTNPAKEDVEYTRSIQEDISWLGFEWDDLCYASNYFDKMYEYAVELIKKGLAYVDSQTPDEMKANRGNLTEKGTDSPYRNRSIEQNLSLFEEMKDGKFKEGELVLRAKIDMASPNMNMRDPAIYRISHESHHNTGDKWCIYPMYDFAHPLEDAIEGITHSLCSLEFENHRPLYDWVVGNLDDYKVKRPRQIEFARLNIANTVTSKRYLKELVDIGVADGWDDPRMPTISGLRRRGVTAGAIRNFCEAIGTAKTNSTIELSQFDYFIRDDLMQTSKRVMAVIDPLKVIITNYAENEIEYLDVPYQMDNENSETRKVAFGREIYIERADFMIEPPKKYFRLFPGNEVRLMGAYFIKCNDYKLDENGKVVEIYATYDPETKSGSGFNARKVKGTIHFVSAQENIPCEIRMYDSMFDRVKEGDEPCQPFDTLNGFIEASQVDLQKEDKFQFVRNGFFCCDKKHHSSEHYIFNKTTGLKASWVPPKAEA